MRKRLKKFFIPHKHNKYNPHLFRNTSIVSIFVLCSFLLGVSSSDHVFLSQTVLGVNIASNVLVDLANENRTENELEPLKRSSKLDHAATLKVDDMVRNGYFAHYSPDGTSPWVFFRAAGYNFSYAGENLARNYLESKDVDEAWMNSPLHRENLLNTNFRDVGISVRELPINGENSVYVVQMFGAEAIEDEKQNEINTEDEIPMPPNQEKIELKPKMKVLVQNKEFIAVKNPDAQSKEVRPEVFGVETYSTWYDRFIFDSSYYIQIFYIFIIIIITIGICIRSVIEYKRQHYRHLFISVIFLFAILVIAALNLNLLTNF